MAELVIDLSYKVLFLSLKDSIYLFYAFVNPVYLNFGLFKPKNK